MAIDIGDVASSKFKDELIRLFTQMSCLHSLCELWLPIDEPKCDKELKKKGLWP